jgi:hypothetical protein
MKTNQARMDANMGSMKAELKSAIENLKTNQEETMACQGNMEACLEVEEPASKDRTPEVAHDEEIPKEDAVVMPVAKPRKRRRDRRNLAAVRRQKEQDQNLVSRRRRKEQTRAQKRDGCRRNLVAAHRGTTREYCESRKNLTATGREETRRAKVARHKQNFVGRNRRNEIATGRNHTEDKIERGTQRVRAPMKRLWTRQVGGTGPDHLGGGSYVASWNIKSWTLWRGRPPPKQKKEQEAEEEPVM